MIVSAYISVGRRIQAKVPDAECLYLTCLVSELWPWLSGPGAFFSSCCLGRGGPSPASLFSPLLPAASPSITYIRCLLGTFISSLTENEPLIFSRPVSKVSPWKSLTNRGAHVGNLVAGSREVTGNLYFCRRSAKTNSFPLTAALCEKRRGRGGIPVRNRKNGS